ncbi:MAG: alpha/beta hydrolase [Butyrivibrio sp.]|nr:alpha/beta hydrolase [Butyrivibrio sp.]
MSELTNMIRKMFKEGDDIRDAGLTTPEDIKRFDDIVYGSDATWQVLDVYRPKSAEGKLPVIISVHGGGWVYGDKERYQYYCMSLAQRGFAVVNFTYRLAPEFKFPSPIEDANLVAGFVMKNAEEYGFDTDKIFAVGDSAGAHLLGLYSCFLTNSDYAKKFEFTAPEGFALKAIALNCGVSKVEYDEQIQEFQLMKEFLPGGATKEEIDDICIVNFVNENYPPAFVMTADGDFLKDKQLPLVAKLMENNVPHIFRYYMTSGAPLGHVFHCNMKLEAAHKCNDEECNFFKSFL